MNKKFDDYIKQFKPFGVVNLFANQEGFENYRNTQAELNAIKRFLEKDMTEDWASLAATAFSSMLLLAVAANADASKVDEFKKQLETLLDYLTNRVVGLLTNRDDSLDLNLNKVTVKMIAKKTTDACEVEIDRVSEPFKFGADDKAFSFIMARSFIAMMLHRIYSIQLGMIAVRSTVVKNVSKTNDLENKFNKIMAEHFALQISRWTELEQTIRRMYTFPQVPALQTLVKQADKRYSHLLTEGLEPDVAMREALSLAGKFLSTKITDAAKHVERSVRSEHEAQSGQDGDEEGGKMFDFGVGLN